MHILMISALEVWALPSRGGAPTLYRTLRAYGERGHRVSFVTSTIGANAYLTNRRLRDTTPVIPADLNAVTFERFHLPAIQETRLPLPRVLEKLDQKLRFALVFPRMAVAKAEGILKREPVDLLYGYEVHGALAVGRLLKRHHLPAVTRFQGTVLYPALGNALSRVRRYEEIEALQVPADLYVMTDDGTRGDDVLASLNPAALPRMRFWRNGLDLERLHPLDKLAKSGLRRELDVPLDSLVLLTASRLAGWKRINRAVEAMPAVLGSIANALLVIVGDGEERAHLGRQAVELGVEEHVRFVGAVPQDRVAEYMQSADVLLALADLSNVGNPLLEAMACGLAIVTLDAGDTRDLIRDGHTGVLLDNASPGAVVAAIVRLADTKERNRLGSAARAYATEHFWTWEERLKAEIDDVERVVEQGAFAQGSHVAG